MKPITTSDLVADGLKLIDEGYGATEAARILMDGKDYNFTVNALRKQIQTHVDKRNLSSEHSALANDAEATGFPIGNVKAYWNKSKNISAYIRMPEADLTDRVDALRDILDNYKIEQFSICKSDTECVEKALQVTISDAHVGMSTGDDVDALFKYEYNEQVFKDNINKVFASMMKEYRTHGKFEVLYIRQMGDGQDGYDGQTTRRGHSLHQNMGNKDQFRVSVEANLWLADKAIQSDIADKIVFVSVANCNHSGDFGYMVNYAVKGILERAYTNTNFECVIMERFLDHYNYGDHTFILTHGKDKEFQFKGLPFELTDRAINFINQYIEHYEVTGKYIHVDKGDLHRAGYAKTKKFDYRNHMAFSPGSQWVSHNFGDTYAGYSIQVVPKHSNEISHCDYYFEFEKVLKRA